MHRGGMTPQDRTFVRTAAKINNGEIQGGTVAQRRAASPVVRQLASRYVQDHTLNMQRLASVAASAGVPLPPPSAVTPDDRAAMMKLQRLSGAAFDATFVANERKGHVTAIQEYQQEISAGSNPRVLAYARTSLPVLKAHLALATQASTQLHGRSSR